MKSSEYIQDDLETDPRWHLVQRVVASSAFSRSSRLSEFLLFVSKSTLQGETAKLNEQEIGVKVFGRSSGYLPSDDNIVRANASRLRQRLAEHFATEGQAEQLRIYLPKGGYVPEFTMASAHVPHEHADDGVPIDTQAPSPCEPAIADAPSPAFSRRTLLTVAALLVLLCAATAFWVHKSETGDAITSAQANSPSALFWASLFDTKAPTLVVPADSSLVLYETLTHHDVSLSQYINGDYRIRPDDGTDNLNTPKALAARRLTSMSDLDFAVAAAEKAEQANGRMNIKYARDLQMKDLKNSNIVLLGASSANPWVSLFENERKFSLVFDLNTRIYTIQNHSRLAGEFDTIKFSPGGPEHLAYALVAYVPNMTEGKHVLILEGSTIAGTEAASDFIFDASKLDALLFQHMKIGGSIPSFEFVLESNDFSGTTPNARVIASRFW
jgi:hypothetical protein